MTSLFAAKKRKILEHLSVPDAEYSDFSPKGSVDEGIRVLIDEINSVSGLVTTSSCAGRLSVFLEGRRKTGDAGATTLENDSQDNKSVPIAGPGGKGGGKWLYVSHDPVQFPQPPAVLDALSLFGLSTSDSIHPNHEEGTRYIHFKFEPMILHILVETLQDAQNVLSAALAAGFRESGAVSVSTDTQQTPNPVVAVRSSGLAFDSIVGYENCDGTAVTLVDESYLQRLIMIANERFKTNTKRIARFREVLHGKGHQSADNASTKTSYEDPEIRRQRKRLEGLNRQQQLKSQDVAGEQYDVTDDSELSIATGLFG